MTPASQQALEGLRDLSTIKWYVIPLLAFTFYIYTLEIKKARATGNWNVIFAGLTVFGMDFINKTWTGYRHEKHSGQNHYCVDPVHHRHNSQSLWHGIYGMGILEAISKSSLSSEDQ